ncbi:MAG: DUF4166 domain-containing protein, partial [Anaerolineae bacterium]|nr:DUF4166 domain-containing protein [Anaerolineae bacterium]
MTALSLFRAVLGADFERLAPVLQRHYDLSLGQTATLSGTMQTWARFAWMRLFIPFMPKNAQDVPVVVRNAGVCNARGDICFEWRREFRYPSGTQRSDTLTQPAPAWAQKFGACVMDVFPQPAPIGIVLALEVSEDGQSLTQRAPGPQFLLVGQRLVWLPPFARLQVHALERALDAQRIYTEVTIRHPLLGDLFGYRGELF